MKKIILLISFCCFGFIMQAQEFLIESLGGYSDSTVIIYISNRNMREDRTLLFRYLSSDDGKLFSKHEEFRKKWLKQIKNEVLTRELKHSLKDTSIFADKRFWIYVYFDKEGKVFTVTFEIEKHIYNLLPEKWVKETFNFLMKEKINITEIWETSSAKPDALARMKFSVKDFFLGKIRDQKELIEKPTKPKRIYPPCGTFTTKIKPGYRSPSEVF